MEFVEWGSMKSGVRRLELPSKLRHEQANTKKLLGSTCILTRSGIVYSWTFMAKFPPPLGHPGSCGAVIIPDAEPVEDIVGVSGTTFARTVSKKWYVWGINRNGKAGVDRSQAGVALPIPLPVSLSKTVVKISGGSSYTFILTDDGTVLCYGFAAEPLSWQVSDAGLQGSAIDIDACVDRPVLIIRTDAGELIRVRVVDKVVSVTHVFQLPSHCLPTDDIHIACGEDFLLMMDGDQEPWLWVVPSEVHEGLLRIPYVQRGVWSKPLQDIMAPTASSCKAEQILAVGRSGFILSHGLVYSFGVSTHKLLGRACLCDGDITFEDPSWQTSFPVDPTPRLVELPAEFAHHRIQQINCAGATEVTAVLIPQT